MEIAFSPHARVQLWLHLTLPSGYNWDLAGREANVSTAVTPGPLIPDPPVVKALEAPQLPPFGAEFFMVCKVPEVTGLTSAVKTDTLTWV